MKIEFYEKVARRMTVWGISFTGTAVPRACRKGDEAFMDKSNSLAKARAKSTAIAATVFLLPALLLIVIFMIYPVIDTFVTSTYKWNGISADKIFVGFDNWKTLFKDMNFWNSFIHNVIVMIFSILLQIPLGLLLATFLDAGGRKFNFFKIVWFLPYLMSSVAIAFLFNYILATNGGLFSSIATLFSGHKVNVDLLGKEPVGTVLGDRCHGMAVYSVLHGLFYRRLWKY